MEERLLTIAKRFWPELETMGERERAGGVLVLYTDGITEAQNGQEALFGEERLLEVTRANLGQPAPDVLNAVLAEVRGFVGDAPQSDDITLMIVTRDSTGQQVELD